MPKISEKKSNRRKRTSQELILEHSDEIIRLWIKRVRKSIPLARRAAYPLLINTFPALVTNFAEALSLDHPKKFASDSSTIGCEHGAERARMTRFDPKDVIREYQILRDVLLEVLSKYRELTEKERRVIIDSTDRATAEAAQAYFLERTAFRERFTLMLTHDLRTPLTIIKLNAQRILRYSRADSHSDIVEQIIKSANQIEDMIHDLLDASRSVFGEKIQLKIEKCELRSLLQECLEQTKSLYGDRFVLKASKQNGHWDPAALKRAVENLLQNAAKYGEPGSITLEGREKHGRTVISVHNRGNPIPKSERENIFNAFHRSPWAQKNSQKGWGLGLALVRGVAESHGGSAIVDSSKKHGTTFMIDIPTDARPYKS